MSDVIRVLESVSVDWPEADVASSVLHRIESPDRRTFPVWARAAVTVAAGLVLLLATPGGRDVVANVFEVAGITITWGEVGAGAELDLGEEISFDESNATLLPQSEPDAVFVSEGVLHMVWIGDDVLPAAGDTGVATLYSQYDGQVFTEATKSLGAETELLPLMVRGREALWIEGAPHAAELAGEPVRLAANVLIWEEAGLVHRIESTGDLASALELADSLG